MTEFFMLFVVGTGVAFAISVSTGRTGLGVFISVVVFIMTFTVLNMGGGHFVEALSFGFGVSMFQAIPNFITAAIGTAIYSKKSKIEAMLNMKPSNKK